MPISRKQDFIREIFMMVRKESVSFEPQDRVKLDLTAKTKDGQSVSYYIGNVFYDFDSGKMCYNLYDKEGFLIVPKNGIRVLEDQLTSSELKVVSEKVAEYSRKSIFRAKNVALISDALDSLPDHSIEFSAKNSPEVCIDRQRTGNFDPSYVHGVYKNEFVPYNPMFLSVGSPETGETFSYPFADLSDIGVSTVLSSIEQQLGKKLSSEKKAESKQTKKDVLNHSM